MSISVAYVALLAAVAVLAVVLVLVLVLRTRGRHDWAEPFEHSQTGPESTGRAPYGPGAPGYATAPPPAATPSMSEGVEGAPIEHDDEVTLPEVDPAPETPRRIDDTLRFREQHKPDGPQSE